MKKSDEQRFWEKVDKSGDCWIRQGCDRFTYAGHPGGSVKRYAYETQKNPILRGMFAVNTCGNTQCVRGDHLILSAVAFYVSPTVRTRTEKSCTSCGSIKKLGEFTPNKRMADRRISMCKTCMNTRDRKKRAIKPKPPRRTDRERLLAKLDVNTGTESCWPFSGTRNRKGYGLFHVNGRGMTPAHRVAYEIFVGRIPDDMTIDHLCRNRICGNPWHLEVVTGVENSRRGIHVRLNKDQVRGIRELHEVKGQTLSIIAKTLDLPKYLIGQVIYYQTWITDMGAD